MDVEKSQVSAKIETAKRMAANKDYTGARSRLLEVHNQFPGLKKVPHMITACDILVASDLTLDGETDWYWVLQLSPAATLSQLRSRYDKLTALLGGIEGDFPGAITALKLVHDAFNVLSSTPKSWVFNSKRLTSAFCEPVESSLDDIGDNNGSSLNQELDSSVVCESLASEYGDIREGILGVDEKSSNPIIEIVDSDVNEDINQWNKGMSSTEVNSIPPFLELEETDQVIGDNVGTTMDFGLSDEKPPILETTTGHKNDEDICSSDAPKRGKAFQVGQIWAAYDSERLPRRYARINQISQSPFRLNFSWLRPIPKTEDERKWCLVRMPVVCGPFNLNEDEESSGDANIFSHLVSCTASPTYDEFEILPQEDEVWAVYKDWRPLDWLKNPESRKGCSLQVVWVLEGYSDEEGVLVMPLVKVGGSPNIYRRETKFGQEREGSFTIPAKCLYRFSHQLPACELQGGKLIGVYGGMSVKDPSAINFLTHQRPVPCPSLSDLVSNMSLKVEWTSEDFASSQVWAVYDGLDQMPRQYVFVNKVFPSGAAEVRFLEPLPNQTDNDEEVSWIEENLPVGCGSFKLGTKISILPFSKFSHLVNCDRTAKNMFFKIYPKQGEIWAMYKNWNKNWKQQDFSNCDCQIVEITSDFTELSGVHVTSLKEVPGFKTFFHKQLCNGFALNRAVPKSEMLSFSHRIEAFIVPGIEGHGVPEFSWHLEPDALPPHVSN